MAINKKEIFNMTSEARNQVIEEIIDKVSIDKKNTGKSRKTKWKDRDFVREVILDYIKLLTIERNLNREDTVIAETEALHMLFTTFNFRNKPDTKKARDTFEILDKYMTMEQSNQVFMGFSKVVTTALQELDNKLEILERYRILERVISDPRKLMISYSTMSVSLSYYEKLIKRGIEKRKIEDIPIEELLTGGKEVEPISEEMKKERGGR